jgi:DNA-directed RNA polymerase specialized sigma24 family protein
MDEHDVLAERFEAHRSRLGAVAYQMLGSASEADDAVQEAWLRLSRADPGNIENLGGWLTTVVARVCLNMLQSRRDEPAGVHLPESVVSDADGIDPEQEALLADSIGPALLVILHTLAPAERLAFILHDIFAVPFDDIAVTAADGRPITLVAFTITSAKIVAIDLIDDPARIAEADLAILGRRWAEGMVVPGCLEPTRRTAPGSGSTGRHRA